MSLPATDSQLIARIRQRATELQVRASLDAERADDSDVSEYLQEFANGIEDCMGDSLTPAEETLARNERERDVDPKARRVNMPVETESPA